MKTSGVFGPRKGRLVTALAAFPLFLAGTAQAQIHLPPPTETSFSGTIASAAGVSLIDPVLIYNNYLFNTLEGSWAIPVDVTAILGGYTVQTGIVSLPTFGTNTVELIGQYTDASCTSDCGVVISVDPNSLLAAAGSLATGGAVLAPGDPFNSVANPSGTVTPIDEPDFSTQVGELAAAGAVATGGVVFTNTAPQVIAFAQEDTGAFSDTSQGGSISGDQIWSFSGAAEIGTLDLTEGPQSAPEPSSWLLLGVFSGVLAMAVAGKRGRAAGALPGGLGAM